ncbi:MAG: thiamine pyrophosphate-binding protein [Proteobacteria bacterium]|nr:thiamine pyrophosphate-binding protein [Pseudomonadota bacterium]
MPASLTTRSGGRLIAEALRLHGADHVFFVPGESYLDLLNGLFDVQNEVKAVTCRFEVGAVVMAEAYGKLTGRPGVAIVTRGPGASHGMVGIHTAFQDSTPLVLLVGQVPRDEIDRESFQEMDYRRLFAATAKWVTQIDDARRIPEIMAHAFHLAASGRPGPVVVAIPEDMQLDRVEAADCRPYATVRAHPGAAQIARMRELLARARRPILLLGGSGWSEEARQRIRTFAEANRLPTCVSFRRQDIFDGTLSTYIGDLSPGTDPALVKRVKEADLLLAVGARLGQMTTQGYSVMGIPDPGKVLIHVHADAGEIGRVFQPTLGIQSGMPEFAEAVAELPPLDGAAWAEWTRAARADRVRNATPPGYDDPLDLGQCMAALQAAAPADAIFASDAGNFSGWISRFLTLSGRQRLLGPTNGAMGYGVPAAVGAAILHPDRQVFSLVGDGGIMMTGLELATAAHYRVKPVVLVFNNGMYGTIRMHQEREYPGRIIGTEFTNPDFVRLIEAFGGHGEVVRETKEFAPALRRAMACGRPALLDLRMNPDRITTRSTLSGIREKALAGGR